MHEIMTDGERSENKRTEESRSFACLGILRWISEEWPLEFDSLLLETGQELYLDVETLGKVRIGLLYVHLGGLEKSGDRN